MEIIVLQRGWVVCGRVERVGAMGQELRITGGGVICRWGARGMGLPGLAKAGPQADTVINRGPPMRVHELAVVMRIECDDEKWRLDDA